MLLTLVTGSFQSVLRRAADSAILYVIMSSWFDGFLAETDTAEKSSQLGLESLIPRHGTDFIFVTDLTKRKVKQDNGEDTS
jgi:hypothetical protein